MGVCAPQYLLGDQRAGGQLPPGHDDSPAALLLSLSPLPPPPPQPGTGPDLSPPGGSLRPPRPPGKVGLPGPPPRGGCVCPCLGSLSGVCPPHLSLSRAQGSILTAPPRRSVRLPPGAPGPPHQAGPSRALPSSTMASRVLRTASRFPSALISATSSCGQRGPELTGTGHAESRGALRAGLGSGPVLEPAPRRFHPRPQVDVIKDDREDIPNAPAVRASRPATGARGTPGRAGAIPGCGRRAAQLPGGQGGSPVPVLPLGQLR